MRANALIYPLMVTVPGAASLSFDERGVPIITPNVEGDDFASPIEGWAQVNSDSLMGVYEDGEFRQCSLTVLLNAESFEANTVKVVRDGDDMGIFRVMQREHLRSVGRIRLMLRQ